MASNTLRHFTDVEDLFDSGVPDTLILEWVNQLYQMKTTQREMGKRYRVKQAILAKLAEERMDPDELKRVRQLVEERVEEGE